jgi:hypothetical protein
VRIGVDLGGTKIEIIALDDNGAPVLGGAYPLQLVIIPGPYEPLPSSSAARSRRLAF